MRVRITDINLLNIIVSTIAISLLAYIIVKNEHKEFENDIKEIKQNYSENVKRSLKKESLSLAHFINYHIKEHDTKKEILNDIKALLYNDNYHTSIYTLQGIDIFGTSNERFFNPNDEAIIFGRVEKSKEGVFINYMGEKTPKISYAIYLPTLDWILIKGQYIDEMKQFLREKELIYQKKIIKYITGVTGLFFFIFLSIFLISRYITKVIKNELEHFKAFFEQASSEHKLIDSNKIFLRETQEIARFANDMVREIEDKTTSLQNLNATLEERIAQKTQRLRQKNSELEASKEKMQALIKSQDRFIRTSIHEINTPLAIILMNIELYEMKYEKNIYFDKVVAGSRMIQNLYKDLEYYIKKEYTTYSQTHIDIAHYVDEKVEFFADIARFNKLRFHLHIDSAQMLIFMSEVELQRLIDNNLSNSIKYSKPNSVIDIYLSKKERFIFLEFVSSSKKIENIEKIFDKFYRENTHKGGFGIGLNLVKEICDKNGIDIRIDSNEQQTSFLYRFKESCEDIIT